MEIEVVIRGLTVQMVRDLAAMTPGPEAWRRATRLIERTYSDVYRGEREHHPEWVDLGGEA
jgi:hypothetical protein